MTGVRESTVFVLSTKFLKQLWITYGQSFFLISFLKPKVIVQIRWEKWIQSGHKAMKQYYNFKGSYSIILLSLVDFKYRFIWASVGAPGITHDFTLFQATSLWKKVTAASFLPQSFLEIEGQAIPLSILGDGAFQIRTWIIKPYGIVWNGHTVWL